jgi:hypothetical protein
MASTPLAVHYPAAGLVLGEVRIIKGRGLEENPAVASARQNLDDLGDKPRRGLVNPMADMEMSSAQGERGRRSPWLWRG